MDIMDFNRTWYGVQTIKNTQEIAARLQHMLTGKRYAFVAQNYGFMPSGATEIRTDQKLEDNSTIHYWEDKEQDPPRFAGFHANDTYGVWGVSTSSNSNQYDPEFNTPYWVFEYNQAKVIHRAGAGHILVWIIAVQEDYEK